MNTFYFILVFLIFSHILIRVPSVTCCFSIDFFYQKLFNLKVIEILKSFSQEEVNKFRKVIYSPYFNNGRKVTVLFNELIKFYPHFASKLLTKKHICLKLSGEENFNLSTFRSLCFDLQNLLYKFLSIEHLINSNFTSKNFLLKELNRKGHFNLQRRIIKKTSRELDNCKDVDFDYFYERYIFDSYKYNYIRETGKVLNKSQALCQISHLSGSDYYLTLMFITELVCDYINIVVFSDKYNIDVSDNHTLLILKSINLNKLFDSIRGNERYDYIIELYSALYWAYNSMSKHRYLEYKRLIKSYSDRLSTDEKSFHYSRLISFCIIKNNNCVSKYFVRELFKLYEFFLMNEYYVDKKINYIPNNLFRAILLLALSFKKYQWAENFVNIYHTKVQEKERLSMYYFGYALLYYEMANYEKCKEFIKKFNIDNFIFKFDVYVLKLKTLIENENPQEAIDLLESFDEFLRKDNMLSEDKKKTYINFGRFASYLIKFKEGKRKYELGFIKTQLMKTENVTSKNWLLEKISILEEHSASIKIKILDANKSL